MQRLRYICENRKSTPLRLAPTAGALLLALSLAGNLYAQSPNSWRGLVLDHSTIEEAVSKLGPPNKSGENQKLRAWAIGPWLDNSARFTKLEWKGMEGIDRASLYFRGGVLRAVEIDLKEKITSAALQSAYGIEFVPKVSGINIAFSPQDYERHAGKVYPKLYPTQYYLIGVSPEAYVVGDVWRSSLSVVGRSTIGAPDDTASFPGHVHRLQLISTSLRDARGTEALK